MALHFIFQITIQLSKDYFLWGCVYKTNSQTIPGVEDIIIRLIGEIKQQLRPNVIQHFNERVYICGYRVFKRKSTLLLTF